MNEKTLPTKAGATLLREEDLDKVQGGGTTPLAFKVEINGIARGARKDNRKKST